MSAPTCFGLVSINVLFLMAHNVFPSIFVLFVGYRFNWGPQAASMMLVATGLSQILVQTLVVGRVVKAAGERGALLIGLVSATLAFLAYGLASTPFWFFCRCPGGCARGVGHAGVAEPDVAAGGRE